MTFKDLQKVIESRPSQGINQLQLQKLKGKPFWIWDKARHKEKDRITKGECCFQHLVGLPKKNGKEMPLYDYEKMLYDALLSPGFLNGYPRSRAEPEYSYNVMYPFKEKHLWCLKSTGLGVSEFFLRLMAWLCLRNDDCRNSQMVIITGPNINLAIKLIKRMKGLFLDKLGVTFDSKETVLNLNGCEISVYPSNHNPDNINPNAKKSIGIDPGFGSSRFAIVITQYVDGKIQVIHAEEYDRPNFTEMIDTIWQLKQKCGHISNIYVDAANPEVWKSLKREFNEPFNQQYMSSQIADCKKYNLHLEDRMIVVPIPFSVEGAHMLQHAKWLMEEIDEDGSSLIAIDKRFDKLLTGLRTAVANEYKLDKEVTSFSDILDAFRLALTFYKRSKQ